MVAHLLFFVLWIGLFTPKLKMWGILLLWSSLHLLTSPEKSVKIIFALTLIAAFAVSPLAAQHASASSGQAGARGNNSVPMNSPEPITMIALAGGAAAAGGLAGRRRRKQK